MVCTNLGKWVDDKDDNKDRIGDWCEQAGPGLFNCTWCNTFKKSFKNGKCELIKHANSAKHKSNRPSASALPQPTLPGMFNKDKDEDDTKLQAENLAIALTLFFGRHDFPFEIAGCITEILKTYINDSKIVEQLTLGKDKMKYIAKFGLGEEFRNQTVQEMKDCLAFGLSLDESEVNKSSQLECVAKIATKEGTLELKHYATLEIEKTDAESIVKAVSEKMSEDGIDYRNKVIDLATDGCSTMVGERGGVVKKFKETVPDLPHTGSCSAHNVSNVMKHAVNAFDPDLKLLLVDLYEDIGGAKGKGLKKMHDFHNSCYNRGFIPKPLKKFLDVRFRTFKTCTEPVIFNFDELVFHYRNIDVKVPEKSKSERQKRIIEMIVKREIKTRLSLMFIASATLSMTQKIDYFESNNVQIGTLSDVIESLFVDQAKKIFVQSEVMKMDDDGEMRNKTRVELASLDVEHAELLPKKLMFVGNEATKYMKNLDITPSASKIEWFYDKVVKFHTTAITYILKYFSKALRSPVMDLFSALNQNKRTNSTTAAKLKDLASVHYSKVVSNIDAVDGADKIVSEINNYVGDDDIKVFEKMDYVQYWVAVGNITEGASDWARYEVLPKLAIAMAAKFVSNSEVERKFSQQNLIHSNKSRNCLSQEGLNACLHIKSAVESQSNREGCPKCETKSSHCHCSSFHITSHLREECRKARGRYVNHKQVVNSEKIVVNEEMNLRKQKAEAENKESFEKKKVKFANRANYFSAQLEPVYEQNKKKKKIVTMEKSDNIVVPGPSNNNDTSKKRKNNNTPSVASKFKVPKNLK